MYLCMYILVLGLIYMCMTLFLKAIFLTFALFNMQTRLGFTPTMRCMNLYGTIFIISSPLVLSAFNHHRLVSGSILEFSCSLPNSLNLTQHRHEEEIDQVPFFCCLYNHLSTILNNKEY